MGSRPLVLVLTAALALPCGAQAAQSGYEESAPAGVPPSSRPVLKQAARIEAAPRQGGRYRLTARFAREASAGELREGRAFSLIGRLAKAGASCDVTAIFSDGFEGN